MKTKLTAVTLIAMLWSGVALAQERSAQPPRHPGHRPPPQAFEDCQGKSAGDAVQHTTPHGVVDATCEESPEGLVARPLHPPAGNSRPQGPPPRDIPDSSATTADQS